MYAVHLNMSQPPGSIAWLPLGDPEIDISAGSTDLRMNFFSRVRIKKTTTGASHLRDYVGILVGISTLGNNMQVYTYEADPLNVEALHLNQVHQVVDNDLDILQDFGNWQMNFDQHARRVFVTNCVWVNEILRLPEANDFIDMQLHIDPVFRNPFFDMQAREMQFIPEWLQTYSQTYSSSSTDTYVSPTLSEIDETVENGWDWVI